MLGANYLFVGPTTVNVRVTGLTPGPHGFHIVSLYFLFRDFSGSSFL